MWGVRCACVAWRVGRVVLSPRPALARGSGPRARPCCRRRRRPRREGFIRPSFSGPGSPKLEGLVAQAAAKARAQSVAAGRETTAAEPQTAPKHPPTTKRYTSTRRPPC